MKTKSNIETLFDIVEKKEALSPEDIAQLKQLLEQDANNINIKDKDGSTLLYRAARNGHTAAIELLIKNGAKVNEKNNGGSTPLHAAARNGHTEAIELLITNGAKVNEKNNGGSTPLNAAALNGHTEAIESLIKNGAKVNEKNNGGFTPLHSAAEKGHTEAIALLITNGAKVNEKNNGGFTPLHAAASGRHTEAMKLLITNGAKVNEKNNGGFTPLYEAAQNGHTEAMKLLIEKGAKPFATNSNPLIDNAYKIDQILSHVTPTTGNGFMGSLISNSSSFFYQNNVSNLTNYINSLQSPEKDSCIKLYTVFITCRVLEKNPMPNESKDNELLRLQHVIENVKEPALKQHILAPHLMKRLTEMEEAATRNPNGKEAEDLKAYNAKMEEARNQASSSSTVNKNNYGTIDTKLSINNTYDDNDRTPFLTKNNQTSWLSGLRNKGNNNNKGMNESLLKK